MSGRKNVANGKQDFFALDTAIPNSLPVFVTPIFRGLIPPSVNPAVNLVKT